MKQFLALGLVLATAAYAADNQAKVPCSVNGSVVNAQTGEPIKKAQLTLSNTSSESSYSATTDEGGTFCMVAPETGRYELLAQKRGFVQTGQALKLTDGQTPTTTTIRMTPQSVIVGKVVDGEGDPIPGATMQAIQSRRTGAGERYSISGTSTTNDLGEYRIYGLNPGRYYVVGAYRSESGYGAAYYPNVQEVSRAVPVDVPAGAEVPGVNLTVSEIHAIKIRGIVGNVAGVKGIMIVAAPCDAGPLNRATTTVQKSDGAFELRDLTPGCYILAGDTFAEGKRYSARMPITVTRQNIDDVNLRFVPPVQLTGRVRIEGAPDFAFRQVMVNLEARASKVTASGAASENGSLLLNNIVPETYELTVGVPDGYYLKSAKYGEADVLRSKLDLSHGADGLLDLEIGSDGGRMDGTVADGEGQPVEGARVALIPKDETGPARQKVTATNSTGAFSIRGIAPGDYLLYAARDLNVSGLYDPAYVKQLELQAKTVSIHERGVEVVNVKAISAKTLASR